MGTEQCEARITAIVKVDAARLNEFAGRVRFALAGRGNDDRLGHPGRDIQLSIQPRPITHGSVVVRVRHRPRDIRNRMQKRAVNRHRLSQQFAQTIGSLRTSNLLCTQLAVQRPDDRNQTLRINEPVEIRERALADPLHRKMLLRTRGVFALNHSSDFSRRSSFSAITKLNHWLRLPGLTQILDRPQRAYYWIEKRQQIHHEDVIQKQLTIPVQVFIPQTPQLFFEQPHILRAHHVLGPLSTSFLHQSSRRFIGLTQGGTRLLVAANVFLSA